MQIFLFSGGELEAAMTSAIFMVALVALLLAVLSALIWGKFGNLKNLLKMNRNRFSSTILAWAHKKDYAQGNNTQALISTWIEAQGNANYKIKSVSGFVMADFLQELLNRDFTLSITRNWCELERPICTFIYQISPLDNPAKKFMLAFNTGTTALRDTKERNRVIFEDNKNESVTDYEGMDGDIVIASGIEIIIPTSINEYEDEDFKNLVNFIRMTRMKWVHYDDVDRKLNTQLYRLTMLNGRIDLMPIWKKSRNLTPELINATFMPFTVKYQGIERNIKPSDFVTLAAEYALYSGENVQLFGSYGTGKTTLSEMIQHRLTELDNTQVIVVSPAQLRELQTAANQSTLLARLTPDPEDENPPRIIFCIDDAEKAMVPGEGGTHNEDNTLLLGLLDGDLKQQLGCSVMLSFNADKSQLNQGMFRAGRKGMSAEIYPLSAEQANKAVAVLRTKFTNKTFDTNTFNTLLNNDNKLPNGVVYSKAGTIVLADIIHECFRRREFHSEIIRAIKAFEAPEEVVETKTDEVRPPVQSRPPKQILQIQGPISRPGGRK